MSDLLNKASLVMVPSGYKEDTVYSVVPSDGSGDLSFTRASNGTRVNSAGLVEVVPWNLVEYSETFDNVAWIKSNANITANNTTAPNGTATADKIAANGTLTSSYFAVGQSIANNIVGQPYTATLYAKAGTLTQMLMYLGASNGIYWNLSNGQFISYYSGVQNIIAYNSEAVGDGWYKYTISLNASSTTISFESYAAKSGDLYANYTTADNYYLWGAQLNIGSTAKPYFPTTDRQNVPRLTYQNGGGGCPSLLLEKQSTNILTYSEDFSNAAWAKLDSGSGSTTPVVTANYAISPDGTQNADRLQCTLGSSGYSLIQQSPTVSGTHTGSIWVKSNTGANQNVYFRVSANSTAYVVTPEWQRINITEANGDYLTIGLRDQTGYTNYSCDILIWGAQLEASSYATSYIVSTSSSATRVADDIAPKSLSSVGITSNYTLFFQLGQCVLSAAESWILQSSSGANTPFQIYGTTAILYTSAGYIYPFSFLTTNPNNDKVAVAYNGTNITVFWNGVKMGQWTATTEWANLTTLDLLYGISTQVQYREVALFNVGLSDADAISLTTL